jgi:hypothetical protein
MNWVGIISICVTVSIAIGGGLLSQIFSLRKEMGEIKIEHQRALILFADKYVRSPEFAEFKAAMRQDFEAIRHDISSMRALVSQLSDVIHELKGAVSANNPPRG